MSNVGASSVLDNSRENVTFTIGSCSPTRYSCLSGAPTFGHHLILGGCGFIGRHVAALLAYNGHRVVLAGRSPLATEFPADIRDRISWRSLDLAMADWDELIEGAAVVHHYAWSSIPASANCNLVGDFVANVAPTLELLEALRRRGREGAPVLVFASSGGTVYGKLRRVPVHEAHPLDPINVYGAGKASVEHYLGAYRALHNLHCRIARLANPFGAGQDLSRGQGAVTTFLHHALTHQPIVIWGDGEAVRDYVHISDLAAGLVALACAPAEEGPWIFNIGSGQGVSLNGIISELEVRLGRRIEVRRGPGRVFDVPVSVLDVTLAREALGWTPKLSFSDGLTRTLADLRRGASLSTFNGECQVVAKGLIALSDDGQAGNNQQPGTKKQFEAERLRARFSSERCRIRRWIGRVSA